MSINTLYIKRCKLAPTVTVLCTQNFTCTIVHAKAFYVHENQCTQISVKPCYVKIPVLHFFGKVNKAQLKMVNVNYQNGHISQYCHFNKIIKGSVTSFQYPAVSYLKLSFKKLAR